MKKALLIELWGLGDVTLATSAIRCLLAESYRVTVLCKPASSKLLSESYPTVHFENLVAPWTIFRGKYRLWRWHWLTLFRLIQRLRFNRFDLAIGWRKDPRDHFLMWLIGACNRVGRPTKYSRIFLTHVAAIRPLPRHTVDCWRDVLEAAGVSNKNATPWLAAETHLKGQNAKPVFVIHCGAQQRVRRWPTPHLRQLIFQLRQLYIFKLILIPDPDGYGQELSEISDVSLPQLSLDELVSELANANLVFSNDSAPAHIAAALETPVITFFGPQLPDYFSPFGAHHHVVIRDICPYRPCADYCHFSEPICLTKLTTDEVWPEIQTHIEMLINTGILPTKLRRSSSIT